MPDLAPVDSILGQLQRGRGSGYLRAIREPAERVWPPLVQCITADPRWDRQLEERAAYYGDLAAATDLDLAPIAGFLRDADDTDRTGSDAWLAVGVLEHLAQRGSGVAVNLLCSYVSSGQHWFSALECLVSLEIAAVTSRIESAALRRFEEDDALQGWMYGVDDPGAFPWCEWRQRSPALHRALSEFEARRREPRRNPRQVDPAIGGLGVSDLLKLSGEWGSTELMFAVQAAVSPGDRDFLLDELSGADRERCFLALRGLGALSDPATAGPLRTFLEGNPDMPVRLRSAAWRALVALPGSATHSLAAEWLNDPDWRKRRVAGNILETHATAEDVPRLRAAIPAALEADDQYHLTSLLEACQRTAAPEALPELRLAFEETPYAWARRRAAEAMDAAAPEYFAQELAPECVWDCEEATRELACDAVDLRAPGVRFRLEALARDPLEEDDVRAAAAERLEDGDDPGTVDRR